MNQKKIMNLKENFIIRFYKNLEQNQWQIILKYL